MSLAQAAFLFFVWEIKLLVGKVSGHATCHGEVDESGWGGTVWAFITKAPGAGGELAAIAQWCGREGRVHIESPTCVLCGFRLPRQPTVSFLGCDLSGPFLVLPLRCPVQRRTVAVFLASQAPTSAGFRLGLASGRHGQETGGGREREGGVSPFPSASTGFLEATAFGP